MSDFAEDTNVPANDCISRQAAIDAINVYMNSYKEHIGKPDDSEVFAHSRGLIVSIESSINALPSAEPKKGRWDVEHGVFMHDNIYGDIYRCSVCGYRERNPEGFNYCPNCGAKMEMTE